MPKKRKLILVLFKNNFTYFYPPSKEWKSSMRNLFEKMQLQDFCPFVGKARPWGHRQQDQLRDQRRPPPPPDRGWTHRFQGWMGRGSWEPSPAWRSSWKCSRWCWYACSPVWTVGVLRLSSPQESQSKVKNSLIHDVLNCVSPGKL